MLNYRMNWKMPLKPLFSLIAKPGLGNPHASYEIELLRAGVKPVAIAGREEVDALKSEIDNGKILIIDTYMTPPQNVQFFFLPENQAIIENLMVISQKIHDDEPCDFNEIEKIHELFERPSTLKTRGREAELAWHSQRYTTIGSLLLTNPKDQKARISAIENIDHLNVDHITVKMIQDKELPFAVIIDTPLSKDLEHNPFQNAINENRIQTKTYSLKHWLTKEPTYVLAQADKIEQGRMLFDMYFNQIDPTHIKIMEDNGAPAKKINHEWNKTVGKLLGYTDNDINWHMGAHKYQNPLILKIMQASESLRRWARKEIMLMDAKKPSSPAIKEPA